jgi:Ca2+/Na+ antiporter
MDEKNANVKKSFLGFIGYCFNIRSLLEYTLTLYAYNTLARVTVEVRCKFMVTQLLLLTLYIKTTRYRQPKQMGKVYIYIN